MTALLTGLVIGFLGSLHCVAMCGGIAGALSVAVPPVRRTPLRLTLYHASFSAGRIASYVTAGALVGAFGTAVAALAGAYGTIVLRGVAALLLIGVGLYLGGWSPVVTRLEQQGAHLWRHIAPLTKRLRPGQSPGAALALGALWGWLPCGLVYSALAMASTTGGWLEGAALMLGFGAGTAPAMLGIGVLADRAAHLVRGPRARQLAGAMVIAFAVWTFAASGVLAARRGDSAPCHTPPAVSIE